MNHLRIKNLCLYSQF